MISIKQLTYALAAEQTLHFKKAAEQCNVSQSALSTAISELEKHLGLQIFERDNKKVLITPVGKEVLNRAREILLSIEDLEQIAEKQQAPLSFPMSVGVIPTIAPYLIPLLFPALKEHYPTAKITMIEEQSQVLVDLVRRGEIDTAILALPYPLDGLLNLEFWQEDFYWVAPLDEPFADQKAISSEKIKQSNLLLLKDGHCLKDHILDVCKFSDPSKYHQFGATSLNTLVQMVQGGMGTTLIPEMARQQLIGDNKKLAVLPLEESSPHRRLAFIIRPNYTRLSSVEALEAICREALEKSKQ